MMNRTTSSDIGGSCRTRYLVATGANPQAMTAARIET
jgi:hypothetical protein